MKVNIVMAKFYLVYGLYKIQEIEAMSFESQVLTYGRKYGGFDEITRFDLNKQLDNNMITINTNEGSFGNVHDIFYSYNDAYDFAKKNLLEQLDSVSLKCSLDYVTTELEADKQKHIKSKRDSIKIQLENLEKFISEPLCEQLIQTRFKSLTTLKQRIEAQLKELN